MKPTSRSSQLPSLVILSLTLVMVYSFARTAEAVKEEKEAGFLGYLFEILSADEVPSTPRLSPADLQAMDKIETLLTAQNDRAPSGGNFVLLGALAAAKNDIGAASCYLQQACQRMPNSPMADTMAAQVYAQAGDFERAKAIHCRALKKVGNVCQSPALAANSYMDLAVVYAQSGDLTGALKNLKRAESLLMTASRDPVEAALGWLQMGIVYADSMRDEHVAMCAWKNGSAVLKNAAAGDAAATLKIDLDVRVADALIADAQGERAARYLTSASESVSQLSAEKRPEAQFQIGASYVELAEQFPDESKYADMAAAHLSVLTSQESAAPALLGAYRDAALAHAKLLKNSSPQEAEKLIEKARTWTLEIGEMNSAYEPIFSQAAKSPNEVNIRLSQHSYGIRNP